MVSSMAIVRLKIDVSGTVGDEAWRELKQFDQIQSADFGPQFGSGGRCNHPLVRPHNKGEWIGAEIRLQTPLLAQYAVSHYLEQDRVLDADVLSNAWKDLPPRDSSQRPLRCVRLVLRARDSLVVVLNCTDFPGARDPNCAFCYIFVIHGRSSRRKSAIFV